MAPPYHRIVARVQGRNAVTPLAAPAHLNRRASRLLLPLAFPSIDETTAASVTPLVLSMLIHLICIMKASS
jgi:hypothetical protein